MALEISKQVNILGDLSITNLYIRFFYKFDTTGKTIRASTMVYHTRNSYDLSEDNVINEVVGIPHTMKLNYDRSIDGTDILTYIHQAYIDFLTSDDTIEQPVMVVDSKDDYTYNEEESVWLHNVTGRAYSDKPHSIYDDSGTLITETIITRPKFCEISDIQIVDI